MVPWESNPSGGLILRKLLTPRNNKMEKNHKNAEVRYTTGTRNDRRLRQNRTEHENPMGVQEEIDQLRDAHRRTALALVCQLLRNDPSLTRDLLLLRLRTEMRNSEWFEYETNVQRRAVPAIRMFGDPRVDPLTRKQQPGPRPEVGRRVAEIATASVSGDDLTVKHESPPEGAPRPLP